ncbi:DHA3 family macrolide efflux protein-like MFS transporter [Bacilli bacterium PM5-9]|nr:DHA3 family macrolide efflux protein-like MFS transporter [Bacilli bacterium PM5-9]
MIKDFKKQFYILYSGQTISIFTSSIIQMAIVWYLIDTTKSAAVLTMATLIGYCPQAIIGFFAGTVVDRFKKKTVMIVSDLFISLATFALFIMLSIDKADIMFIYFILFLRSVGSAFHSPSLHSLIPLIVPKDMLVKYAGYSKGFESFSDLVSPAVAAMLYSFISLKFIVLLDIVGAIFAVITLQFVKVVEENREKTEYHYIQEFKEGIKIVRKDAAIINLMIICGLYAIIYSPIGTLFPYIAMDYFKVGVQGSAIVETTFAIGTLLGSFLLGFWGYKFNKMLAISGSIALYAICLIVIGLLPISQYILFYIVALIMGMSIPFYRGIQIAIIQIRIDHEYLGRVVSIVTSITRITMPIGLILASLFAQKVGINNWYAFSGVICLFVAIYAFYKRSLYN